MLGANKTQKEIADTLKLHPFVVQKTVPQAKRFTAGQLKFIYQKLADIDFELKNSQTKPELLFDLMVMDVCK
jgi:DNA polymerase III delta subunit